MKTDGKWVLVLVIILMTVASNGLIGRASAEVNPAEAYSAEEFGGDSQACYRACVASSQYTRPDCEWMCFTQAAPVSEQPASYPATAVASQPAAQAIDPQAVSTGAAYPVAYPVYVGTEYPVGDRLPAGDNTGGKESTGTDTSTPGTDTSTPSTDTSTPSTDTSGKNEVTAAPEPVLDGSLIDWAQSGSGARAEYVSNLEKEVAKLKSENNAAKNTEEITKLEAEITKIKAIDAKSGSGTGSTDAQSQKAQVDSMVKSVQDKLKAQGDKSKADDRKTTSVRSTASTKSEDPGKKTTTQASGAGDTKKQGQSSVKGTSQSTLKTGDKSPATRSTSQGTPGTGDKSRIAQGASQGKPQTVYRQGAQQTQQISRFGQAGPRQYAQPRTTAAYTRPSGGQMTMGLMSRQSPMGPMGGPKPR